MRDDPRFRFGSGGIGQEIFSLEGQQRGLSKSTDELKELRAKHEFIPDAQERFDATLEKHGYEHVRVLENGYEYPTLDEWVALKIDSGAAWAPAYPSFIRKKETGDIHFAKVRIKPKERQIGGGLTRESEILGTMKDLPAAQLIAHFPEDEGGKQLEMLVLEVVKFSEGSVLMPQEWTPSAARSAVREIKRMETMSPDVLPEQYRQPKETVESLLKRTDHALHPTLRTVVEHIQQKYIAHERRTFVHGDAWPKNVIVGLDRDNPSIKFVDWELAGAGYIGQDAGRLWWGICAGGHDQSHASREFLAAYLDESTGESRAARRAQLLFGVAYEVLWRLDDGRVAILKKQDADESDIRRAQTEVESVNLQAAAMLTMLRDFVPNASRA